MRTNIFKNEIFFVFVVVLISILIKLLGLNYSLYDDEAMYASAVVNAGSFGFNKYHYTPILMQWSQLFFSFIFGLKIWVMRLVPLIFGTLTMLLSYQLAKERFGLRAAKITLLIMSFSFYPVLSSLQLDAEGSLITFFYLLAVYSFLKIEENNLLKWKLTCGFALLFSLLSKHNAILIFAILFVYVLIKEKARLIKVIKKLFVPFSIGIGGYLLFLWFAYLVNPNNLLFMFGHGSQFFTGIYFSSIALPILFFWGTPLLLGLVFLAIYYRRYLEQKKSLIFYVWLSVILLFYIFIIKWGDYSRYLANLVPPMAILGANFLSKIKIKYKHFIYLGVFSFIFLLIFFWLNILPKKLVPRFFESYLAEISNFNFNFLFTYTASSGPTFGINFFIILFVLVTSFLFILLFVVLKNRKVARFFLFIFLTIGIAFNVFLVSEFLFHPTSPDVSSIQYEMADYFKENDLKYPLYSNDEGIMFNINKHYRISRAVQGIPDNELDASIEHILRKINSEGGTILLLHWPPLPEKSPAWEVIGLCDLRKQFYSKNSLVGEIYVC